MTIVVDPVETLPDNSSNSSDNLSHSNDGVHSLSRLYSLSHPLTELLTRLSNCNVTTRTKDSYTFHRPHTFHRTHRFRSPHASLLELQPTRPSLHGTTADTPLFQVESAVHRGLFDVQTIEESQIIGYLISITVRPTFLDSPATLDPKESPCVERRLRLERSHGD